MKTNHFYSIFIASVLMIFSSCSKDEEIKPQVKIPYESAEQYIEEVDFQGAILLRKGSTYIVRSGYGMANTSQNIPNTVNTKFRIGSASKAFTSLGILQLIRDGQMLSLDQTVSEFIEDFPFGDQITIRNLLKHSSGLPDHTGTFEELFNQQNIYLETEEIINLYAELLADEGLSFTPYERFAYSNTNYLLLAFLIEELSGKSYHQYLYDIALSNLGMNNTYKSESDFGAEDEDEAIGYRQGQPVAPYPIEIAFGAGDWASTIDDMEKWGNAWMNGLLSPEEKTDVFPNPEQDEITSIGMGWFTIRIDGKLVSFHGGDIDGFTSVIALLPESNGIFIALSNKEGQRNTLDQMMEAFVINEF